MGIQMSKYHVNNIPVYAYINDHIEEVVEDAISYPLPNVRKWSEEVCKFIYENETDWVKAQRKVEHLRLQYSQRFELHPEVVAAGATGTGGGGGAGGGGSSASWRSLSGDLLAAEPGPLCKHYNMGMCKNNGDHVMKGYRHLHYCSFCAYARVELIRHSEKDCSRKKVRDEKRKQNTGSVKDF